MNNAIATQTSTVYTIPRDEFLDIINKEQFKNIKNIMIDSAKSRYSNNLKAQLKMKNIIKKNINNDNQSTNNEINEKCNHFHKHSENN